MVVLAEPDPEDMVRAVRKAIDILPGIDPQTMHLRVSFDYTWLRALLHIGPLSEMGILHQLFFSFSTNFICKLFHAYSNLTCIVDEKTL
jgi:hypothetical protein